MYEDSDLTILVAVMHWLRSIFVLKLVLLFPLTAIACFHLALIGSMDISWCAVIGMSHISKLLAYPTKSPWQVLGKKPSKILSRSCLLILTDSCMKMKQESCKFISRSMQGSAKIFTRSIQGTCKYLTIFMQISRIRLHQPMILQDPVKAHASILWD